MAHIAIVDDHQIFREGVAALVETSPVDTLIGTLSDTVGLDRLIREKGADTVLLDLSLEGRMTFGEIERLKRDHPGVKVIVLSMHADQPTVEKAMQAGADSYALKQDAFDDLIFAIRASERGGRFISPTIISQGNVSIAMEKTSLDDMPKRQREILQLLTRGLSNKQIAAELGIALPTVKNHLSVLFRKYGVSNRVGLLAKLDLISHESTSP